jgi:hypothetical protein
MSDCWSDCPVCLRDAEIERLLNADLLEALREIARLANEKAHGPIGVIAHAAIAKATHAKQQPVIESEIPSPNTELDRMEEQECWCGAAGSGEEHEPECPAIPPHQDSTA